MHVTLPVAPWAGLPTAALRWRARYHATDAPRGRPNADESAAASCLMLRLSSPPMHPPMSPQMSPVDASANEPHR